MPLKIAIVLSGKDPATAGPFLFASHLSLNQREGEGAEREIEDAVGAEDDDEADKTPHNRAPPLGALRLVRRSLDEFEHAPDEEDKRRRCQEQNNRIDNLRGNLIDELAENSHLLLTDPNA